MGTVMTLKRCLYLLPVIFINTVLTNNSYKRYYIESDKLCSLGFRPKIIEIDKDERSAAIVEEVEYFSTLSGKYPYKCKFEVESTQEMGVFAVIQKLKLRKNATTGECIDYVQFRHTSAIQVLNVEIDTDNANSWGEKHCGDINAVEIDVTSIDPTDNSRVLPYAFVDPKGKVGVKIYIANETIPTGTNLDLKIAFTAYFVCRFNMGKYKKCGADACIWSTFFSDGILNCPFTNCADENCQLFYDAGIRPSAGLATKVMVGAVAGVFTMFIVFVMFLWLFRHCSLCWNDSPQSAQNTAQMRPVPTVDDAQPTAPPGSPSMDKDLPPSYESLFPTA